MKCNKYKDKNILVLDEHIKDRWKEYFNDLFNGEQEHVVEDTTIIPLDENSDLCEEYKNQRWIRL